MEYVILVVGLAAVGAAWDGFRRAVESDNAKRARSEAVNSLAISQAELERRVTHLEGSALNIKNTIAEVKNFAIASQRKR